MKKLFVILALLVALTGCESHRVATPSISNKTVSLGSELRFPRGWYLHSFAIANFDATSSKADETYIFICVNDDNIYRFCAPEVVNE